VWNASRCETELEHVIANRDPAIVLGSFRISVSYFGPIDPRPIALVWLQTSALRYVRHLTWSNLLSGTLTWVCMDAQDSIGSDCRFHITKGAHP
jgi:hypothetical protein